MTLQELEYQFANHIGWGGFLALALNAFMPIGLAVGVTAGVAAAKETLEAVGRAPWMAAGTRQDVHGAAIDFAFLCVGALLALLFARY